MSKLRTIDGFKSTFVGGGARPNLFEVDIPNFPISFDNSFPDAPEWKNENREMFSFMCKAAALPSSVVDPIEIPFRGTVLKVPGDRTFDTWTVTIINDENFFLRNMFELWMNSIVRLQNFTGATNPNSYQTDAYVYQLGRGANKNKESTSNSNIGADRGNELGVNYNAGTPAVPAINDTPEIPAISPTGDFQSSFVPLKTYKFNGIFPTNVSSIDLSYDSTNTVEEFTVEFQVQYWTGGDGLRLISATDGSDVFDTGRVDQTGATIK